MYQKKRKERDRDGVFVAEGERLVTEAPPDAVAELYLSASYYAAMPPDAERFYVRNREKAQVVSDEVFAKMSDTKTPQGILAVVRRSLSADASGTPGCAENGAAAKGPVLVLDGIRDPGNLGTILRTSEAAGAGFVALLGDTADVYQPKAVRASMGSIFRVRIRQGETVESVKARGYAVAAADMDGTVDYDAYDWKKPTALVIGNEANGLSEETRKKADTLLRIPMAGKNESLNAAVAAAVLLFEAARQLRK